MTGVGATVTADAVNTGAVIGGLLGLAVVGFIAAFILVSLFSRSIHISYLSKRAVTALYKAKALTVLRATNPNFGTFNPLRLCY